ncbi:hypothetical protein HD806DRAFT_549642 [Xylariaceae sp. AK1471]|nr:hypothetical protein HD806DRAFT_549642 [Xylariaceae sp. AK1471]
MSEHYEIYDQVYNAAVQANVVDRFDASLRQAAIEVMGHDVAVFRAVYIMHEILRRAMDATFLGRIKIDAMEALVRQDALEPEFDGISVRAAVADTTLSTQDLCNAISSNGVTYKRLLQSRLRPVMNTSSPHQLPGSVTSPLSQPQPSASAAPPKLHREIEASRWANAPPPSSETGHVAPPATRARDLSISSSFPTLATPPKRARTPATGRPVDTTNLPGSEAMKRQTTAQVAANVKAREKANPPKAQPTTDPRKYKELDSPTTRHGCARFEVPLPGQMNYPTEVLPYLPALQTLLGCHLAGSVGPNRIRVGKPLTQYQEHSAAIAEALQHRVRITALLTLEEYTTAVIRSGVATNIIQWVLQKINGEVVSARRSIESQQKAVSTKDVRDKKLHKPEVSEEVLDIVNSTLS